MRTWAKESFWNISFISVLGRPNRPGFITHKQGSKDQVSANKSGQHLFLKIKFYWNTARPLFAFCLWLLPAAAAAAKSRQSCPTLCDPIDGSPTGSSVPGILQARTLEWVAISFSNAWKWKVKVKLLSLVWLLATPWTVAYQAPPSMGFSRQEYWSGVPSPSLATRTELRSCKRDCVAHQV